MVGERVHAFRDEANERQPSQSGQTPGSDTCNIAEKNRALWHYEGVEFSVDCSGVNRWHQFGSIRSADRPGIVPGRLPSQAAMAEQLAEIVDSIRTFEPILALLKRKSPATFDHVCEGAQAFVAACVVRHHSSRSCWILCPDARRQEEIF